MKRTGFFAAAAALLSAGLLFSGCDDFDEHEDSIVRTMLGLDDSDDSSSDDTDDTDDTEEETTIADGTYVADHIGSGDVLGTVRVTIESGEVTAVSVGGITCEGSDTTWYYSTTDDDGNSVTYTFTLTVGTTSVFYTYTSE